MTQQNDCGLTETQKEEIDEIALQRVRAMNSDEFLCQSIDKKIHAMEENIKAYFKARLSFHMKNGTDNK
ncbi:hypothetical protein [Hafnia paralvei]|uniref:hypothetical protein n=1 Tax=Hafnia paralvei TaxID=546367 RepID=UPI00107C436F|nr:hypothetical protein [Hafnia paralvei]